jgi:DNA repair protein RadD
VPGIQLRDFQAASVEQLRNNIRTGIRSQVLSAPTGSGKTICAAHLLDECYNKGRRAVFVADRISLIDQTSAVLDRYGIPHGVIQSNHWRTRRWERIQVASADTLARRGWPEFDLMIVDECHTQKETTRRAIGTMPPKAVAIGLTATPFSKGLGTSFKAVVSVTTTNRLIEEGHLCRYRVFAASEPDMEGAKVVAGEWTDAEAEKRSMPIIGDCVAEYLKHTPGTKFIAFGVSVAHCEEIQKQFMAAGVHCALYTYQNENERGKWIEEFRKPDSYIRGLISVSALAKGFDVSDVETIIVARPLRSSLAEHIQMLGRGLRSHPGKEMCTVLDHSGNCVRFWDETNDFFENGATELDDGTRKPAEKKRDAKEKKPKKCPKCFRVHDPAPACPNCGYAYPRNSNVAHVAGELSEVGSKGKSATAAQKQDIYSQLLYIAHDRNRSDGWVAHTYRDRFKVWPAPSLLKVRKPPTQEIERWVKGRIIAHFKAKAGGR